MASSFLPGAFGSQKISARPRIERALDATGAGEAASEERGPGTESSVTPGFRRAGWMVCIRLHGPAFRIGSLAVGSDATARLGLVATRAGTFPAPTLRGVSSKPVTHHHLPIGPRLEEPIMTYVDRPAGGTENEISKLT